ncbi:hypothetical protein BJ170DRAFT_737433 [Xylariales sp. AK1849]|nr:hypothetical protein BJ170DRAFT_737433 [Xylariales sp. AK1849]
MTTLELPALHRLTSFLGAGCPTPWETDFTRCLGDNKQGLWCGNVTKATSRMAEVLFREIREFSDYPKTESELSTIEDFLTLVHCHWHRKRALAKFTADRLRISCGSNHVPSSISRPPSCQGTPQETLHSEASDLSAAAPLDSLIGRAVNDLNGLKISFTSAALDEAEAGPDDETISKVLERRFTVYQKHPTKADLIRTIEKDFEKLDNKEGVVYVLADKQSDAHYKVGWTTKSDVTERLAQSKNCTRGCRIIFQTEKGDSFVGAHRVERLVQADLCRQRRRLRGCADCDGKQLHNEWFEVSEEEVLASVQQWTAFVREGQAYENGKLTTRGRNIINITAKVDWQHFMGKAEFVHSEKLARDILAEAIQPLVDATDLDDSFALDGPVEVEQYIQGNIKATDWPGDPPGSPKSSTSSPDPKRKHGYRRASGRLKRVIYSLWRTRSLSTTSDEALSVPPAADTETKQADGDQVPNALFGLLHRFFAADFERANAKGYQSTSSEKV